MFLGIDLGTGSMKLMLLEPDGTEHTVSRVYTVRSPEAGWAEIDPRIWLEALESGLKELPHTEKISGIGLSGQMHGIIPCGGETGRAPEPLMPAVTWADRRAGRYCSSYNFLKEDEQRRLGNPVSAGMAGLSLLWIRDEKPEIYKNTETLLLPKDFVRATLTGDRCSDFSDASGTLLYDFTERSWYHNLIENLGLRGDILPELKSSLDVAGFVTEEASRRFGLPSGIPVVTGAGDTPAALYGTGLTDPAIAQISIGTAAQVSRAVPGSGLPYSANLNLFEGVSSEYRCQIAAMLNGGLALEWVRRQLGFDWEELYRKLEVLGLERPNDLIFIPHLSGERTPYMNPDARGAWIGLSIGHEKEDLALSALLGVAASVRLGAETLEASGSGSIESFRFIGGSARYPFWRKLLAGMLGRPLQVSGHRDGSVRGAAMMAARAVGTLIPDLVEYTEEAAGNYPWMDGYYHRQKELYRLISGV
jgi:xylulokinase